MPFFFPQMLARLPFMTSLLTCMLAVSTPAFANPQHQELIDRALRFEHAEGVDRDFSKAASLYCEAAVMGSADAYLRLGWMYANGRGLQRNDTIAATLFRRSASLGNEMAGRLSEMIRSDKDELPTCLQRPLAQAPASLPSSSTAPLSTSNANNIAVPRINPSTPSNLEFRKPIAQAPDKKRVIDLVLKMAPEFRLDPRLVLALILQESNFDPTAKSSKNAQGLMQLIPETAERFAIQDVLDPVSNLRGGMAYLRWLLAYFKGDVAKSLAGYNAGEGVVDKFNGVPPYAETMAYVQRIRAVYPFDRHPYDKSLNVRLKANSNNQTTAGVIPPTK